MQRRKFLLGTVGAGLALTVSRAHANTATASTSQNASARIIVDSQVHLWLPEAADRPWTPGGASRAHMPRPFGYDELLMQMNEAGVDRAILVPPPWEGVRNDYVMEAARKHPDRFAVMGLVSTETAPPEKFPATWRDQQGMLGIRVAVADDKAHSIVDGTTDWLWRGASAHGIPVMAAARGQAAEYQQMLKRFPDLILILDHVGVTLALAKAGRMEQAIQGTIGFAKHPNVSVKLSALAHKSMQPYPFRDLSPYLQRVFDAFGPQRCYWGTDLTAGLAKLPYTYRQYVTHFTETLEFLSEDDKDWVMGRALLRRLGWVERPARSV